MTRAMKGAARKQARKKVLKAAKGFWGGRSKLYRKAKETLLRAGAYAYRDRRTRKRNIRSLWIVRIHAAAMQRGLSYSQFIGGLAKAGLDINRKLLADMAINDAKGFDQLVQT
ncbi:MAG: 50S ribosomal protein L20, partial [Candidatus Brocadiaceae bacterium]|nr:50S ribosomal protein L20 [Candidatus Brocadiaceae bacterium]